MRKMKQRQRHSEGVTLVFHVGGRPTDFRFLTGCHEGCSLYTHSPGSEMSRYANTPSCHWHALTPFIRFKQVRVLLYNKVKIKGFSYMLWPFQIEILSSLKDRQIINLSVICIKFVLGGCSLGGHSMNRINTSVSLKINLGSSLQRLAGEPISFTKNYKM